MENWLREAKDIAKYEAEYFIFDIVNTANKYDLDADWFLDEVLMNINRLKSK